MKINRSNFSFALTGLILHFFKQLENSIDTNNDNHISQKEIDNANEILKKAKKQKEQNIQREMFSLMESYK